MWCIFGFYLCKYYWKSLKHLFRREYFRTCTFVDFLAGIFAWLFNSLFHWCFIALVASHHADTVYTPIQDNNYFDFESFFESLTILSSSHCLLTTDCTLEYKARRQSLNKLVAAIKKPSIFLDSLQTVYSSDVSIIKLI